MGDNDSWTLGRRKLGLFLGVSASLTLASFLAWFFMVKHSRSKDKVQHEKKGKRDEKTEQSGVKS